MAFLIVARTSLGVDYYLSESEIDWTTEMHSAYQTEDWSKAEALFDAYERSIVKHETSHSKLGPHLNEVFAMGGKLLIVESVLKTVKQRSVSK